jgi:hypothetical protein
MGGLMYIQYDPINSKRSTTYSQPEPDILLIKGWIHDGTKWIESEEEIEFDPEIIEYDDIPEWGIRDIKRINGALHMTARRPYKPGESLWWDTQEYIDFGINVDLMSKPDGFLTPAKKEIEEAPEFMSLQQIGWYESDSVKNEDDPYSDPDYDPWVHLNSEDL